MDSSEKNGLQEMGNQKIMRPENHINILKNKDGSEKSDSFVVDLELLSNGLEKEATVNSTNSRFTLLRNLSRKAPQRDTEKNINDKDKLPPSTSPKSTQVTSMPEKAVPSSLKASDRPQHQIIIKTGGLGSLAEGKWGKRSSFKRASSCWFSHPKRILIFFAVLSIIGTLLLTYFTLAMNKGKPEEVLLDWE